MCDPASLAIASTVATAGSTYMQAQSASAAAKSNAAIASMNQQINERAATDATQRGADDASKARTAAKVANSTLRAKAAGGGLLADTGTVLDIQEQNTGTGELNALTIQNNAEREAYGYKVAGANYGAQAAGYKQQAGSLIRNGLISGASTLVTGAYNYSSKFGVPEGQFPWQKFGYARPSYSGGGFYGTA